MGNKNKLFKFRHSRTRGGPVKLELETAKLTIRKRFFTVRMASGFHRLARNHHSLSCLSAKNASTFRSRLDKTDLSNVQKLYFSH